jgi:ribosomal protein S20
MADLDSLGYKSIIDMSNDEAIDTLRQIRLSRRVPDKKHRTTTKTITKKVAAAVDADMAASILKLLGDTNG